MPTGEIYAAIGEKGMLEFLTIGDYGKNANIKADFLGITRDLNGVPNGEPMPLTEKWVITISTQYGCSMGCKFCDVPKVGIGRNATSNTGYYVAVLNCWFCPKCYNEWYGCATHYPEDIKIENKNFEYYKNLFDL